MNAPAERPSIDRRLRAVLIADAVGSTERTRKGEQSAIALLLAGLDRLRAAVVAGHGRVARVNGDGLLAVFDSAVDALDCALAFQSATAEAAAAAAPGAEPFVFRIGVHVGDVVEIGGEPYGDAVNVAARLEPLAEPMGVCLSRAVYDLAHAHVSARFDALGARPIKGLEQPIEVFRAVSASAAIAAPVVIAPDRTPEPPQGPPSVAVMPLTPLSDESGGAFMARGLAHDITGRLTRFRRIDVIAHASTLAVAAEPLPPREAGRRLRARYVAGGALAIFGGRMRLSVELIETGGDRLLWADSFERPLEQVFEVLNDVAETAVAAMMVEIDRAERGRARAREPGSLDAYGLCLRGLEELLPIEPEACATALELFARAADLDPAYARALAATARAHGFRWKYRWTEDGAAAMDAAQEFAARAVDADPNDPSGHAELGWTWLYARQHARAIAAYRTAMELNPGDADILADYADALSHDGTPEAAPPLFERAIRLNPHRADHYLKDLAGTYYVLGDFETAVATIDRMRRPQLSIRVLAASYAMLGRAEEARRAAEMVRRRDPQFRPERWIASVPDRVPAHTELLLEGLKRAGL